MATRKMYETMSFHHASVDLGNDVYQAAVNCFEALENRRMIVGSGQNLAADVAIFARELLERQKREKPQISG